MPRSVHWTVAREVGELVSWKNTARGEQGRYYGADCLEGLGDFEAAFREAGGTAGRDERVRGRFEGGETRAHYEEGAADAGEGALYGRGPEHRGADPVDAEACYEGPSVAEFPDDPAGVGGGADQVGAEVGTLQSTRFGGCNGIFRQSSVYE